MQEEHIETNLSSWLTAAPGQLDEWLTTPQLTPQNNAGDNTQLLEQLIIEQVIRLSLQEDTRNYFSSTNGLSAVSRKQIKSMKMSRSSQQCSVCLQGFVPDQTIKRLPCRHIFHRQCCKSWFTVNKRCPVCRYDLEKHFAEKEQNKEDDNLKDNQNLKNHDQQTGLGQYRGNAKLSVSDESNGSNYHRADTSLSEDISHDDLELNKGLRNVLS